MPSWIVRLADQEYVEWSTVVDAPVSTIAARAEAIDRWGDERIERADEHVTSCTVPELWPRNADEFIDLNRAGPDELSLTLDAIRERFASDEAYATFALTADKLLPPGRAQWDAAQAARIDELRQAPPTTKGACCECFLHGKPRGTWSPFYCERCDIVRMHRIGKGMAQIPGAEPAKDLEWYEAKSAELRARPDWWQR